MKLYKLRPQAITDYLETNHTSKAWHGDMDATQGIYRLLSRAHELTENEIGVISSHIYVHSETRLEKRLALKEITKELIKNCFDEI